MRLFLANALSVLISSSHLIHALFPFSSSAVEAKALIGDITPKALKITNEDEETHLEGEGEGEGPSEEMEKVKGSSWNHAGSIL